MCRSSILPMVSKPVQAVLKQYQIFELKNFDNCTYGFRFQGLY